MKHLFNSIKIITIALVIGVGVSYVSAAPWSAPGATPTGGNTVASVNVSDYAQTKIGSFSTDVFLKAGGTISPTGALWNKAGYAVAEKAIISPWSFFTSVFLPGSASQVKIGGGDAATTDIFNTAVTPFTIDLAGRGSGNNSVSGRQVIDIRTDTAACYPNATIRTNTPAVELLNSKTGDNADAIVRGVQLSGGNPAPGKVLVSTDANGNAVWGTPTLSGGQIVFTYGTSPVATGQALCSNPTNPIPGCTNSAATNYNASATVDDGSCVMPQLPVCGSNVDQIYKTESSFTGPSHNAANDCLVGTVEDSFWSGGQATWTCVSGSQSITCSTAKVMSACFTADTKITMADGSHKSIQEVNVGDTLKSVSGINTVLKLLRPKLGNQPIYSINSGREFFTANHPFLTTEGWKSIDPEVTRLEIPDIAVGQLKIGDVLITEKGNVLIKTIVPTSASSDTQLYNFELDGDHTYYADGYAVHNKQQMQSPGPTQCSAANNQCANYTLGYCDSSTNTCSQATQTCNSNSDCIRGSQQGQCVVYNFTGSVPAYYYDDKYCIY